MEGRREAGEGEVSDPRPAEGPLEAALAAQTTDGRRRGATIYTLRWASKRVSEPPEKKGGGCAKRATTEDQKRKCHSRL